MAKFSRSMIFVLGASAAFACSSAPVGYDLSATGGPSGGSSSGHSSGTGDDDSGSEGAMGDGGGGATGSFDSGGAPSPDASGGGAHDGGAQDAGALPQDSGVAPQDSGVVAHDSGGASDASGGHDSGAIDSGGAPDAAPDASPVGGVFANAPPYVSQSGGSGHHNAGRDCFGCHGSSGPTFYIGGTVYDANGIGLSNVEIRLVDKNGNAFSVYSCTNGNFYTETKTWAQPARVGIRNATVSHDMTDTLTYGSCNSCHCTGSSCTAPRITLP